MLQRFAYLLIACFMVCSLWAHSPVSVTENNPPFTGITDYSNNNKWLWNKRQYNHSDQTVDEWRLNTAFKSYIANQLLYKYPKIPKDSLEQDAALPIDKKATKETVALYNKLKKLLQKGIMFGHQDDLAYGVKWKYTAGRSDIKEVTGDYPAVQGFELGHLELDHPLNLDSVPFDKMRGFISTTYEKGGVNTISWHLRNPMTGKTAWDPAPGTVAAILPGGSSHGVYKRYLDKLATFLLSLKGHNGEYIPVIFRPFHELNGNWFWWGKAHCTPQEYQQLWHFTVNYLRDTKEIHHLLYAFNTDKFASTEEYLERYPGDAWTDVIGFDIYQRNTGAVANEQFVKETDRMLGTIEALAAEKGKIPALTEFGFNALPDNTWWTKVFQKSLEGHKISYVLGWRNAGFKPESGQTEYYVPYKGHPSAADFVQFYKLPQSLFLKEVAKEKLYQ